MEQAAKEENCIRWKYKQSGANYKEAWGRSAITLTYQTGDHRLCLLLSTLLGDQTTNNTRSILKYITYSQTTSNMDKSKFKI